MPRPCPTPAGPYLDNIFDATLPLRDNGRFVKHPEFSFEEAHDREKDREES
jgi:hypothetical protein